MCPDLFSDWSADVSPDEDDAETAGPSQSQPCCSDASAYGQSEGSPTNDQEPSPNHSDAQSNGAQNRTEPACSSCGNVVPSCGDSPANPECESAAEQPHQQPNTTEEETEDVKQEEACSPSPLTNEQLAKRRACRKRRRSLFTIQAVNSNGMTERAMGEGGSAVSFSCE